MDKPFSVLASCQPRLVFFLGQDGAVLEASDPADTSTIFLGSELQVEFSMIGSSHQPLQLYGNKGVTSPSQDLAVAPMHYSLTRHHGYWT